MTVDRDKLAVLLSFTRTLPPIVLAKRSDLIVGTYITSNALEIRGTDTLLVPASATTAASNILVAIALITLPTDTIIIQIGSHLSREVVRDMLFKTRTTSHILRAVAVHRTQAGATTLDTAL